MKVLSFLLFGFGYFGIDTDAYFYLNMVFYSCFQLLMICFLTQNFKYL